MENLIGKNIFEIVVQKEEAKNVMKSFVENTKEIGKLDFEDSIKLIKTLASFYAGNKKDFDLEVRVAWAKRWVAIYKKTKDNGNLSNDELKMFNEELNYLIASLGEFPLNLDGSNMSKENALKFYNQKYLKRFGK